MLTNRDEALVRAKIAEEVAHHPPLALVVDVAGAVDAPLAIDPEAAGLEIVPRDGLEGPLGRCRMKLFRPREGKDRLCAFFYKRSLLAWSRDRFSYGGVEFLPENLAEPEVRSWIAWLTSGLDPDRRPERLRRAFLYTIPD